MPLFRTLAPAFPGLEALILNGVGEPLLHPQLEEMIRAARERMPTEGWVGFQSNGLLLTDARAVSLASAGLDRICFSIDGVSPETFRKVREGGEIEGVERALAAMAAAKNHCGRPDLQVGVEFVVMRGNLRELPDALRWSAARGATFAIVTHVLPYDLYHGKEAAFEQEHRRGDRDLPEVGGKGPKGRFGHPPVLRHPLEILQDPRRGQDPPVRRGHEGGRDGPGRLPRHEEAAVGRQGARR